MTKDQMFDKLLEEEGGYVDHENDPGGKTKYGVTEAVAQKILGKRAYDITWNDAKVIARINYWDTVHIDDILDSTGNKDLAYKLLTISYNMGPARAGQFLQRVLNALNNGYWNDLTVDGDVGANTLKALQGLINKRGQVLAGDTLLKYITSLQGAFYIHLAEKDGKFKSFTQGWAKRI